MSLPRGGRRLPVTVAATLGVRWSVLGPRLPKDRGQVLRPRHRSLPRRGLNKQEQTHLRASLSSRFHLPVPSPWRPVLFSALRAAPSGLLGTSWVGGFGQSSAPPSRRGDAPPPPCLLQLTVLTGSASHRVPTRFLGLPGPAVLDTGGRGARTCLPPPPRASLRPLARWLGLASVASAEPGRMTSPGQESISSRLSVSRQWPET